ncbi:MAG: helix-turn-helix domain-containing protein [Nitrospirota bacterium]
MEKLLSIGELSRLLGITKSTLYSWTSKKIIPHRKLSTRLIRFEETEILEWLGKKSVYPDAPLSFCENRCRHRRKKPASLETRTSRSHVERFIENAKKEALGDVN